MRTMLTLFLLALLPGIPRLWAQGEKPAAGSLPAVVFTLDFPQSVPDHYSIRIAADGQAKYESRARISQESEDTDTFSFDFTVSPATRAKVFDLASRANYFQGALDSKKSRIASTGNKTLSYEDAHRTTQATYNYSTIPVVQELTSVFQNMATTLEFARRLQYDHRYQKLALDEELKRMEDMAKSNLLGELQAVDPILNQIAADSSVINIVRARAQRLMAMAGSGSSH